MTRLDPIKDDNLANRLFNWKFRQAKRHLQKRHAKMGITPVVNALATTFGDCGWFSCDSSLTPIIETAVNAMMPEEEAHEHTDACWQGKDIVCGKEGR